MGWSRLSKDIKMSGETDINSLTSSLSDNNSRITTVSGDLASNVSRIEQLESAGTTGDISPSNVSVGGVLSLEGGTVVDSSINSGNLTNTYIHFKEAGTSNDWAYLRQIGGNNQMNMALDFHDDSDDCKFLIRGVHSSGQDPDVITTRFSVVNDKVGCGTGSPSEALHVHKNLSTTGHQICGRIGGNTSSYSTLVFGSKEGRPHIGGHRGDYGAWDDLSLQNDLMVLKQSNMRVGIGLTNPTVELHVDGNAKLQGSGRQLYFDTGGAGLHWGAGYSRIVDDGDLRICTDDHMHFNTGSNTSSLGTERMCIRSNGYVGIATATPYCPLQVNGGGGYIQAQYYQRFRYDHTISGAYQWGGLGGVCIYGSNEIVTGSFFVSHNGSLGASDERIKKNIVDADDAECLDVLRQLKPKKYEYRDAVKRGDEPVFGFIAQEVRETLPHATQLRQEFIPNIYELANVSSSNVITFTGFNTADLESNATTLIRTKGIDGKDHDIHLAEVIDAHAIRVEEDLTEWIGSIDETGNVVAGNQLFVYGQEISDGV